MSELPDSQTSTPGKATLYLLMQHVYWCMCGSNAVFLDLRRDKYSAIGPPQAGYLPALAESCSILKPETKALAQDLLQGGLLTIDDANGKRITPSKVPPPSSALIDELFDGWPPVRTTDVLRLLWSFAVAAFALRRGVFHAVRRVQKRNQAAILRYASFPPERARELILIVRYLRPLLYVAESKCLLSSLILSEFLSLYGIRTTLVFGVKMGPFEAHCWLQQDGYVLNGHPEAIANFTPILAA